MPPRPSIAVNRLILSTLLAVTVISAADARDRHDRHRSHSANHESATGTPDQHPAGKNPQVRAASEEVDKIGGKIKNICRGC